MGGLRHSWNLEDEQIEGHQITTQCTTKAEKSCYSFGMWEGFRIPGFLHGELPVAPSAIGPQGM